MYILTLIELIGYVGNIFKDNTILQIRPCILCFHVVDYKLNKQVLNTDRHCWYMEFQSEFTALAETIVSKMIIKQIQNQSVCNLEFKFAKLACNQVFFKGMVREEKNICRIVGTQSEAMQVAVICIEITFLNGYRSISSASPDVRFIIFYLATLKHGIIVFISSGGIFKAIIQFRVGF